jgi:hypothetical protein
VAAGAALPAVVSVEMKFDGESKLTDEGLRAVSSLTGLTSLNRRFCNVTFEGVEALRRDTASSNLHIIQ